MIKALMGGAFLAAICAGASLAAGAPAQPQAFAWIVTPDEDSCHSDIELTGRSGQPAEVALVSDGEHVALRVGKDELPKRAFLAIDVDRKPYSNLLIRQENAKVGTMALSDETVAALSKGGTLLIAWLADEPVSAKLTGSEQAIADLKVCGAQVAVQHRANVAARQDAEARAEAEARAKQLADEQLALVRAQKEAAEAQAQQIAEETRRREAEAEAQRQQALEAQRRQTLAEERQRAEQEQRQDDGRRWYPQRAWSAAPPGYRAYPGDQY